MTTINPQLPNLMLGDFCPINTWAQVKVHFHIPEAGSEQATIDNIQKVANKNKTYLQDRTTKRLYLKEEESTVQIKCAALMILTPLVYPIASICNIAYRALKIMTLSHFWISKPEETKYDFTARLADAGVDLLRIIATPIAIIGLELSAIYGALYSPFDGRKLYTSIERGAFNCAVLPGCFQPSKKTVVEIEDTFYTLLTTKGKRSSIIFDMCKASIRFFGGISV